MTFMSGPKTTPIRPRPATSRIHRHGVNGLSARSKDQQRQDARGIEWNVVGPMPTDQFLDEFFSSPPDLEMESKVLGIDYNEVWLRGFASVPDSPASEEEMYGGLVSVELSICHLSYSSHLTDFSASISTR